jgi:1,4-dihydroxy-2-naphthoyl-CoA hydrolase
MAAAINAAPRARLWDIKICGGILNQFGIYSFFYLKPHAFFAKLTENIMRIWTQDFTLAEITEFSNKYMDKFLGIELTEIGDNFLKGKMPVDDRTKMPLGLLHGGASCVLAESLGSVASFMCIDRTKQSAVGIEINANHIHSMSQGFVVGTATSIHIGHSIHVWEIKIHDETEKQLVCISRLTTKVLNKH